MDLSSFVFISLKELLICAEASSIFFFENLAAPIAHSLCHGAVGTQTTNNIFLEREFRTIFAFHFFVVSTTESILIDSQLLVIQLWKIRTVGRWEMFTNFLGVPS